MGAVNSFQSSFSLLSIFSFLFFSFSQTFFCMQQGRHVLLGGGGGGVGEVPWKLEGSSPQQWEHNNTMWAHNVVMPTA